MALPSRRALKAPLSAGNANNQRGGARAQTPLKARRAMPSRSMPRAGRRNGAVSNRRSPADAISPRIVLTVNRRHDRRAELRADQDDGGESQRNCAAGSGF